MSNLANHTLKPRFIYLNFISICNTKKLMECNCASCFHVRHLDFRDNYRLYVGIFIRTCFSAIDHVFPAGIRYRIARLTAEIRWITKTADFSLKSFTGPSVSGGLLP
jgi:acetone carboxylase gamma subunit